jgi:ribonuclease BN (tRNA processing enzyme)
MKLTFLGVGSAFNLDNWQSNMLLQAGGKNLLIDAGGDIRHALKDAGLSSVDIDAIYVSHLHADHCHGLEYMALTRHDWKDHGPPTQLLFAHEDIVLKLWETIQHSCQCLPHKEADMEDFFKVMPTDGKFTFGNTTFHLFRTHHYQNGDNWGDSFGLRFTAPNGAKVLITTDTTFDERLTTLYELADIIFQDCETTPYKSGVHAHYEDLKTLPADTKRKMWLYHYANNKLPHAKTDGFAGFVSQGQTFTFEENENTETVPNKPVPPAPSTPARMKPEKINTEELALVN